MKITAHCLVKNEENFVWFAINSILDQVDEILIWDTGSIDKTVKIIKSIKSPKIKFSEVGEANPKRISQLRQEMIDQSDADWLMILDGDEIWYDNQINNLKIKIQNSSYDLVVNKVLMCVGDTFHFQDESVGKYKIADKQGHYNIRFIKNKPDLHITGVYPNEAYVDSLGIKLQNYQKEKMLFFDQPYLHLSHLKRSSLDNKKFKYEIGRHFPLDYYYPEVFFRINAPPHHFLWKTIGMEFKIKSYALKPLRSIKRIVYK